MTFAFVLIIIGAIFLLKNLGLIVISWSVVWPLIIIGIGIYIAVVSRRVTGWCHKTWEKILRKLE